MSRLVGERAAEIAVQHAEKPGQDSGRTRGPIEPEFEARNTRSAIQRVACCPSTADATSPGRIWVQMKISTETSQERSAIPRSRPVLR